MNKTPLSNRLHVGIFGKRNAGKSTLMNALTAQEIAIVSDKPGTTTDPVYKAMELHDLGPMVMIDTGGIDDEGPLGELRVKKAYQVLHKTDVAILVAEAAEGFSEYEERFIQEVRTRKIPLIVALNKTDLQVPADDFVRGLKQKEMTVVSVSALKKTGMEELRREIVQASPEDFERKVILNDLLDPGDLALIVAPLDIEAPKGRLKLPQVQTIRDILDSHCSALVVKETEVEKTLAMLTQKPKLVITESQVFAQVAAVIPEDILLTSFSVLYARYKGDLEPLAEGARAVETLMPGDKILIAEACTHHPVGDDIGRVVIPNLLRKRMAEKGGTVEIDYCAGYDFPDRLDGYKMIIHCGGCMLNRREMTYRIQAAVERGIAITNYGIFIAYLSGIGERVLKPFIKSLQPQAFKKDLTGLLGGV